MAGLRPGLWVQVQGQAVLPLLPQRAQFGQAPGRHPMRPDLGPLLLLGPRPRLVLLLLLWGGRGAHLPWPFVFIDTPFCLLFAPRFLALLLLQRLAPLLAGPP